MRSTLPTLLLALTLTGAVSAVADAQIVGRNETVYTWRGTIPTGRTVHRAELQRSDRHPRGDGELRGAPRREAACAAASVTDVGFEVRTSSNGDVSICSTQNEDSCDGDHRSRRGWHRQATVAMTVLIPRGVRLKLATGNGAVSVDGRGAMCRRRRGTAA